ncbi:MAG: hypothetical protein AVDCRST_MAG88-4140, partial [uncultured Thermomicrobiales bacterium]
AIQRPGRHLVAAAQSWPRRRRRAALAHRHRAWPLRARRAAAGRGPRQDPPRQPGADPGGAQPA